MSGKIVTRRVPADQSGIAEAVRVLRDGGIVAVPTETVYGLAARADEAAAVARIFAAKGRPNLNPLIVHVAGLREAGELVHFNTTASSLAERFWPGPLTLVLPKRDNAAVAEAVSAGLPTLAVRVPAHPVMQAVLRQSGLSLAAPSANRSGMVSPTNADHVLQSLGGAIDLVLDAGPSACGLESTIVAVRRDGSVEELRPGPLDLSAKAEKLRGATSLGPGGSTVEAPGQLEKHYAPGKPMRLDAWSAEEGEFLIGFGDIEGDCSLSADGNLTQAAAHLYACLHAAAASAKPRIAVAPIPDHGIGRALNDRLRRAAA